MSCIYSTLEQPPRQSRLLQDDMSQGTLLSSPAPFNSNINWLASEYGGGDDNESILISPFQDAFPKREIFEDIDLSNIPISLFSGQMPLGSSVVGALASAAAGTVDVEAVSPMTLTPLSSSSSGAANLLTFETSTFEKDTALSPSAFYHSQTSTSSPVDAHDKTWTQVSTATGNEQQPTRAPMNGIINIPSTNTSPTKPQQESSSPSTPPSRTLSLPHSRSSFPYQTPGYMPRKRKSTGSATTTTSVSSPRSSTSPSPTRSTPPVLQPRKTTHNMIEKRYRTNLNDKIAALRDAVPSLRLMVHRMERDGLSGALVAGEGIMMDDADISSLEAEQHLLGGLAPAHKLNKATVLSKATEYIAHLERNNATMTREVGHLRNRIQGLEMMLMQQHHQQANPVMFGGGIW